MKGDEFDAGRLPGVTISSTPLAGEESTPFPEDGWDALNDALPNVRNPHPAGYGHAAMNTASACFVDEVLAFIQESS